MKGDGSGWLIIFIFAWFAFALCCIYYREYMCRGKKFGWHNYVWHEAEERGGIREDWFKCRHCGKTHHQFSYVAPSDRKKD